MKRALIALLLVTPAYGQTYDPTLIQPVILGAPTTMTSLGLGDDNTRKVDLGFDFPYYDQTFNTAWVSSNGFISFQSNADLCCNGQPITQAPRNTIYGFWTDLISTTSPFIRKGTDSFLVGWYGTKEYGTNNSETFEISLFSNGNIQFDYGNLALSYHQATAGMTGPTFDDNVQLFYGSNPTNLRYQSGLLSFVKPKAIEKVDCAVTPLDPSCPPVTTPVVSPTVQQPVAATVTIAQAYQADVAAERAQVASVTVSEPVQQIVTTTPVITASIIEQVSAAQQATVKESAPAERLSPEQVAALSALSNGQGLDKQPAGGFAGAGSEGPVSFSATPTFGSQASFTNPAATGGASFGANPVTSIGLGDSSNTNSPTSQANTLEALNMSNSQPAAQQQMPEQRAEANATDALGSVGVSVAFTAYTQVSLQDRPDFYASRDIYRNHRLKDANFEMYRMSQTNNEKWKEMVDAQYGQ